MHNKRLAIVTGASRGLGAALALELIERQIPLVTVSRSQNPQISALASKHNVPLTELQADLSDPHGVQTVALDIAARVPSVQNQVTIINNAGTVEPILNTESLTDIKTVSAAFTLNVSSIIVLCATVLQACQSAGSDCRILNISSGAGRRSVAGWGVYCATKAALDRYTQVLAEEHPRVRAVSLAPGVIDTSMQAKIRDTQAEHFPAVEQFVNMHKQQQLSEPETVASQILDYLDRDDFGSRVLDDIRQYF